jgi:hypothetical protein
MAENGKFSGTSAPNAVLASADAATSATARIAPSIVMRFIAIAPLVG